MRRRAEPSLTAAETRVAELVERGLSNREVATILRRSPNTVRNHLVAIFQKLDVSTRSELVFVRCHRNMS